MIHGILFMAAAASAGGTSSWSQKKRNIKGHEKDGAGDNHTYNEKKLLSGEKGYAARDEPGGENPKGSAPGYERYGEKSLTESGYYYHNHWYRHRKTCKWLCTHDYYWSWRPNHGNSANCALFGVFCWESIHHDSTESGYRWQWMDTALVYDFYWTEDELDPVRLPMYYHTN